MALFERQFDNVKPDVCNYKDFSPSLVGYAETLAEAVFEKFDALVDRANSWLASNPSYRVFTCEPLDTSSTWAKHQDPLEHVEADTVTSILTGGNDNYAFNTSLRLWYYKKETSDPDYDRAQLIGYCNLVPKYNPSSEDRNPQFETVPEVLEKFNAQLKLDPIRGRVLNMNTKNLELTHGQEDSIDPDVCVSFYFDYFVKFTRLFYEFGEGLVTSVGKVDFVPNQLTPTEYHYRAHFETFKQTLEKANAWIAERPPTYNITNLQSFTFRVANPRAAHNLDTRSSTFNVSGKDKCRIHVIRVFWTQGSETSSYQDLEKVSYRTVMPGITIETLDITSFPDTQRDTVRHVAKWVQATGAKLFCAETIMAANDSENHNTEVTYTYPYWRYGKRYQLDVTGFRVFLNGEYQVYLPRAVTKQKKSGICTVL